MSFRAFWPLLGLSVLRRCGACQVGDQNAEEQPAYEFSDCRAAMDLSGQSHGRVCSSRSEASLASNFCMLDSVLARAEDGFLELLSHSCPDHEHGSGVVDLRPGPDSTCASRSLPRSPCCGSNRTCCSAKHASGKSESASNCTAGCSTKCASGCSDGASKCATGCTSKCGSSSSKCAAGCSSKCGAGSSSKCSSSKCTSSGCKAGCCGACKAGCCGSGPAATDWLFRIPLQPVVAAEATPLPSDGVVGMAVNGVVFMHHPMSAVFDECLGHVDRHRTYHYHLPPACLLNKLAGRHVVNGSWWWSGAWPERGPPSPLLGWALDGWPIFGPYDAQGLLMGNSSLDRCGGKALPTGGYGYFVTPAGGPSCFVGHPGTGSSRGLQSPLCSCPAQGLASRYCAGCELTPQHCKTCDRAFFMFPACPKLGPSYVAMARVWGSAYLLVFLLLVARGPLLWLFQRATGRQMSVFLQICRQRDADWRPSPVESLEGNEQLKPKRRSDLVVMAMGFALGRWPRCLESCVNGYRFLTARVMQAFRGAIIVSLSRLIFMLVDPWHVEERLPALLVGPLYGVVYPTLNWCFVQAVFLVALRTGAMPATPRIIQLQVIVNVLEYFVQLLADLLRGFSVNPVENQWLMMCQVYFLLLGFSLSVAWFAVAAAIWRRAEAFSPVRRRQFRLEIGLISLTSPCKIAHSLFSLTAVLSSSSMDLDAFGMLMLREGFVFLEFALLLVHNLVTVYHASL